MMPLAYYELERAIGYTRSRLLCAKCAAKRGLTDNDFAGLPDQHFDCADCGLLSPPAGGGPTPDPPPAPQKVVH